MQKQVHVRVDQAGQQRGVAEVDDRCALRMIHRRSHSLDALALNENFAGLEHVAGIDLKQPRRMQHDRRGGWPLRNRRNHNTGAKQRASTMHTQLVAAIARGISSLQHD